MSALRMLVSRIVGFFAGRTRDREMDDEMRFHLEMAARDLRARGLRARDARREARRQFGGVAQVAEAYRDQRSLPWLDILAQDVRYGARTMRRAPGFALAAILTLALGIGANTAIFSIVNVVLLRPLPYPTGDRLVMLGDCGPDDSIGNVGFATWQDFRDRNRTFDALAAIRLWQPTLAEPGTDAERLPAMRVSWTFFSMLGVHPALGRDFTPEDDRPDRWHVLMLSDALWRRRFAADPHVIGRTILMNDAAYRIVGVLPAGFEPLISAHFYQAAEVWAPLGYDTTLNYACRDCQHLKAVGLVRAGVGFEQARADLDAIRTQLVAEHPTDYAPGTMAVVGLQDELAGAVRPALYVLLGAVGFVLLMACANVANLLLARALHRSREMALRAALGAGRGRLVRQLLNESLILSLMGGALGLLLAGASLSSLARVAPMSIPRLDRTAIDGHVLAFALLLAVTTGLLFGLVPALRASALDLHRVLASDSRSNIGGSHGTRHLLVIVDLALALVLLAGAGLMLKSVSRLLHVDPGFTADRVLTMQFSLVGGAYAQDAAVVAFQDRLLESVRALPGVRDASVAGQIPLGGNGDRWGFHIEGRITAHPADEPSVERYSVTPDYFRVMGIPLVRGRLFTPQDRADSPPVMVISESTARRLWPDEDPIGRRVRVSGGPDAPWHTIVGIAGNVRHHELTETPAPQMYLPQSQVTDSFLVLTVKASPSTFTSVSTSAPTLISRSTSAPASASMTTALVPSIREVFRTLDPHVPIYGVATMEELVGRSVAERRFVMGLLSAFALLALLLAAIGLYGVASYTVAQRTRELGIRVALGATSRDIGGLIVTQGARIVLIGLAAGLAGALVTMRFLRTLLFDVRAEDPATLTSAIAALTLVAALAHWLPARRALRVDPIVALRQD